MPAPSLSPASLRWRRGVLVLAPVALIALLAWLLWPHPGAPDAPPAPPSEGPVQLTAAQVQAQGIVAGPVAAADHYPLPGLPAEATLPLEGTARVVIPYAGVVTRLRADEGAMVRRGQPLVQVQSREALAALAARSSARAEAAAAASQARRDDALLAAGVIPASRHEETRARAAAAQGVLQQADGALAQLHLAEAGMPGEYVIAAPMDGQLLRRDVDIGQSVAALDSAFVIARPGALDLRFNVPMRHRGAVAAGQQVLLSDGTRATVQAVGADTDPASQSLRVRARVDDGTAVVAGQQFAVTLQVPAPAGSLSVPASALLPSGRGHLLYRFEQGRIEALAVQRVLGTADGIAVVQAPGLNAGQQVVVRGTAMLKALVPAPPAPVQD